MKCLIKIRTRAWIKPNRVTLIHQLPGCLSTNMLYSEHDAATKNKPSIMDRTRWGYGQSGEVCRRPVDSHRWRNGGHINGIPDS